MNIKIASITTKDFNSLLTLVLPLTKRNNKVHNQIRQINLFQQLQDYIQTYSQIETRSTTFK